MIASIDSFICYTRMWLPSLLNFFICIEIRILLTVLTSCVGFWDVISSWKPACTLYVQTADFPFYTTMPFLMKFLMSSRVYAPFTVCTSLWVFLSVYSRPTVRVVHHKSTPQTLFSYVVRNNFSCHIFHPAEDNAAVRWVVSFFFFISSFHCQLVMSQVLCKNRWWWVLDSIFQTIETLFLQTWLTFLGWSV